MLIEFPCPQCGAHIRIRDEYAGKVGACKKCGQRLEIPAATVTARESTEFSSVEASTLAEQFHFPLVDVPKRPAPVGANSPRAFSSTAVVIPVMLFLLVSIALTAGFLSMKHKPALAIGSHTPTTAEEESETTSPTETSTVENSSHEPRPIPPFLKFAETSDGTEQIPSDDGEHRLYFNSYPEDGPFLTISKNKLERNKQVDVPKSVFVPVIASETRDTTSWSGESPFELAAKEIELWLQLQSTSAEEGPVELLATVSQQDRKITQVKLTLSAKDLGLGDDDRRIQVLVRSPLPGIEIKKGEELTVAITRPHGPSSVSIWSVGYSHIEFRKTPSKPAQFQTAFGVIPKQLNTPPAESRSSSAKGKPGQLQALGSIQEEITKDRKTVSYSGVVVSLPTGMMMPTLSEYRDILAKDSEQKSKSKDKSESNIPESPGHILLLKPSLFTLEFAGGKKLPASHFLMPDKGDSKSLAAHGVTLMVYSQEEFNKGAMLSFCVGVVQEDRELGRPLRLHLRQEPSVAVSSNTFEIADIPKPKELEPLELTIPNIHIPTIPTFIPPQNPTFTPPVIPKLPPGIGSSGQPTQSKQAKAKPDSEKPVTKQSPAKTLDTDPEKAALSKLKLARNLLDTNKNAAIRRLEEIVKDFPGTSAAKEAEELLATQADKSTESAMGESKSP